MKSKKEISAYLKSIDFYPDDLVFGKDYGDGIKAMKLINLCMSCINHDKKRKNTNAYDLNKTGGLTKKNNG